jgi:D-serine dehydratase
MAARVRRGLLPGLRGEWIMKKRMTKMEACHHLTVIRDELKRDSERMKERFAKESDETIPNAMDHKRYIESKLNEVESQIQALEMAGAALTR